MGMQLSGSLELTGSLNVSGSLKFIGGLTHTGTKSLTGSLYVSGSSTQVGTNTLLGNTTLSGSIIISGSDNPATPTIRIFGDMQTDGVIKFDPVNKAIDNSISASYIFVSGSTQDLYFSQNGSGYSNVTRLRWLESVLYTGLLKGGVLSSTPGSTTFSISNGDGIIVRQNASLTNDPYPTVQQISWSGKTNIPITNSGSAKITYVGIDSGSNVIQQTVPWGTDDINQFDNSISLGVVLHLSGSVSTGVFNSPQISYGPSQRADDFFRAFGPLKVSGHTLLTSGSTLSLTKSSGNSYRDGANYAVNPNHPSTVVEGAITTSKIYRYYISGSTPVIDTGVANAGYTVIDPSKYVNTATGQLATVTGGQYSIQRVFWIPNSPTNAFIVYYGNATYTSTALASAAINTEAFVEAPNTAQNAIFLGYIIVSGNETDLTNAIIIQSGLFRSVGGIGSSGATNSGVAGTSGTSGVSGTSGLNGTFFGSSGTAGTSGAGVANYYGNFYSTGSQTVLGAGLATTASLESTGDANGISVVSNRKITFANSGVYEITFSAMVQKTQGNAANLSIWFQKNGTKIDNSASYTSLVSNSVYQILTVPFIISLNAGDYIEVVYVSDSQYVTITDIAANNIDGSPQAPSWIVTAKQVGVAVGSTSGTSGTSFDITLLNNYTGSNDSVVSKILQTTASLNTQTGSQSNLNAQIGIATSSLNFATSSLNTQTGSQSNLNAQIGIATSSLNLLTSSLNIFTQSINRATASIHFTTSSLNLLTASLGTFTASINFATSSLNTFTGSIRGEVSGLESYTASLKAAGIVSSSTQIQNYYVFAQTSSANTFYGNQTITGSLFVTSTTVSDSTLLASGSNLTLNSGSNLYINNGGLALISGSVIVTGSLIVSASTNLTGSVTINNSRIDTAWTAYTPQWTAASSNPAIGNGTIEGYYKVVGKTCFVRGNIAMGSTTTFGSGEWYVSMPFTASHADGILMTATLLDNGTAWYNAILNGARAGFNHKTAIQYQNTGGTTDSLAPTTPFTWTTSDRFIWNGSYEIA